MNLYLSLILLLFVASCADTGKPVPPVPQVIAPQPVLPQSAVPPTVVAQSAVPQLPAPRFPGLPKFIDEMVDKHQFAREELEQVFQHAQHLQPVIDAISSPATLKPWPEYRASFVNPQRVSGGLQFWKDHERVLRRAEKRYGVPQEIIVALIGVETIYGRNAGRFSTLDALTTLAFDYPRRADFFRSELEQYLLLSREQGFELFAVRGSYAGALGIPQFMPSSYRKYAVDFNGNKKINLMHDPEDAIGSVANYLKQFGWMGGEPVTVQVQVADDTCLGSISEPRSVKDWEDAGVKLPKRIASKKTARLMTFTVADGKEFWLAFRNFDAITKYNNSDFYAMTVYQLAKDLRDARNKPKKAVVSTKDTKDSKQGQAAEHRPRSE